MRDRPYKCKLCNFSTHQIGILNVHMLEKHDMQRVGFVGSDNPEFYECLTCGFMVNIE